ncbi:dynamin family protein [Sphaerospermopsis aphanizomenoides BCCUSP55]|uniref:dynamin family protein n=1 Tax=Sphaerospermopsis aphanizomenoides TaxID=459663 RepID=UPI001904486A|nr:dynamin family protein [Sphaerospermopsis aphanizomenoides]MBK1987637.1 dynamin family protein [Sphaerospermopsis aphanizomenoides BCCUSP55]
MMQSRSNSASIDYRKSVFHLTNYLKQLQDYAENLHLANLEQVISYLRNHLETNSFSIGVFGNFNCGKSTFINALIGKDILPVDILATTATISRITHRETSGAKICLKDGREQEISLDQLADYITKLTSDAASQAEKIQESIVYYPIPYYQNQLEIIDTPGLNDDGEMTAITSEMIHQCDVAIMLISAISPFGTTEGEFLTTQLLANGISRVLFVINAIDLLDTPDNVNKIVNLIKNRINKCIQEWAAQKPNPEEYLNKIGKIQIHEISAFQALTAKAAHNIPLLAQSRFVNFEFSLRSLINQGRGLIQLQITSDRIIIYATEILGIVNNQEYELAAQINQLSKAKVNINYYIQHLRRQKTEIIETLHTTLSYTQNHAHSSSSHLDTKLKTSARKTIESTEINVAKQNEIGESVFKAVQNATREFAQEIQTETQNTLNLCLLKIQQFTQLCEQVIPQLQLETNQLGLNNEFYSKVIEITRSSHRICDSLSQRQLNSLSLEFAGNAETFTFTIESNGAGTAVGAAIGFMVLGPIGGGIGAAIGAATGEHRRGKKFKENYQQQVMTAIDNQLKNLNVNPIVEKYLSQAFSQVAELQNLLETSVTAMLNQTQNQFTEYSGKQEVLNEIKQQELSQMRTEIEKIISEMQYFSQQLSQVSA